VGTIVSLSGGRLPYEVVTTTRGERKTYWVEFDEPQFNVEGDRQYAKAQVLEDYLEALPERP
jgi:hypothetical protein